ncbi:G1 family glutamic endopeptidase [Bacillus thuringiensis]|uniref:G1 family glutamic endopeptidase n=1 Tax=Bacillus thuringiensis TaxID=1428 RepID=UPI001CC95A72
MSITRLRDIPPQSTLYTNWAGYCKRTERPFLGFKGPFTSVHGEWVVPTVTGNPGSEVAIWIGIDGGNPISDDNPDTKYLIQIGTSAEVSEGAPTRYFAWWEEIHYEPGAISLEGKDVVDTGVIELNSNSYPVFPGDLISASVSLTDFTEPISVSYGSVAIANVTRGWNYDTYFQYNGPRTTVEFIVEAPSKAEEIVELANFNEVTFQNCTINFFDREPININDRCILMGSGPGKPDIAVPSLPNNEKNGFTVTFQKSLFPPDTPN